MTDDRCPGCWGPITFTSDNSGGITVNFHCADPDCDWGKPPEKVR